MRVRFPLRHSLFLREPAFAHDALLLACVLVAFAAGSARLVCAVYGGCLAAYLQIKLLRRAPGGASEALDVARSLRLGSVAGMTVEAVAASLAGFPPRSQPDPAERRTAAEALRAAIPLAALLDPVLERGGSLEGTGEYLDEAASYLLRFGASRESLASLVRPGNVSGTLAPAVCTAVLVCELTAFPWSARAAADQTLALVLLAAGGGWQTARGSSIGEDEVRTRSIGA